MGFPACKKTTESSFCSHLWQTPFWSRSVFLWSAAGKSSFFHTHVIPKGYVYVNRVSGAYANILTMAALFHFNFVFALNYFNYSENDLYSIYGLVLIWCFFTLPEHSKPLFTHIHTPMNWFWDELGFSILQSGAVRNWTSLSWATATLNSQPPYFCHYLCLLWYWHLSICFRIRTHSVRGKAVCRHVSVLWRRAAALP